VSHLLELVDEADKNKDGKIDFDEFDFMGMLVTFSRKYCFDDEQLQASNTGYPWLSRSCRRSIFVHVFRMPY
jgi:hypothetical protein